MMWKKLKQRSGDASMNIQAGGDVNFGPNYEVIRQIVLDLFKANFYELSETAAKKASDRAEEIVDAFLKRAVSDPEINESKFEEPATQYSLFEIQKAYARTGDDELKDRLVNTLLARLKSKDRSLYAIVLDEVIATLPKLTNAQVNLLSFVISIKEVHYEDANTLDGFAAFINQALLKFYPERISIGEGTHLQYCGCYTLPMGGPQIYMKLGEYLGIRFKGLLTNGFTSEEFKQETNGINFSEIQDLIIKNLRFPDKYQFRALHDQDFDKAIANYGLSEVKKKLLQALWNKTAMNKTEVENILLQINPKMKGVIYAWNNTVLPAMQLTAVGKAIAVLNYNQVMGSDFKLEMFF